MTTTEIQTKNYERLDGYIDKIVNSFQTAGRIIEEYMNAAKEEGITENEAKAYLKEKIPKSTFYKYLPLEYKDTRKQTRVTHNMEVSGPPVDQKSPEFDTKGMGVAITDDEPNHKPEWGPRHDKILEEHRKAVAEGRERDVVLIPRDSDEKTQSVSCPASSDDEHDRLVARIQELEKMVSDLSFQKGSETPQKEVVPTQQKIRPFILKKEHVPILIADLNHSLNNDVQMFLCEDSWLYWITGYQSTYSSERKRELAQNFEVLSQLNATS